jgi:hypothetical protein
MFVERPGILNRHTFKVTPVADFTKIYEANELLSCLSEAWTYRGRFAHAPGRNLFTQWGSIQSKG